MQSSRWIDRVATALVSIAMSGVVSAVMVLANRGLSRSFALAWVKAWLFGSLVLFLRHRSSIGSTVESDPGRSVREASKLSIHVENPAKWYAEVITP